MLIEHENHAYDVARLWLYLDAQFEFVASATWVEFVRTNGGFDGPANRKQVSKVLSAESDSVTELRVWCQRQADAGADSIRINRTWKISESEAPKGHRLHGKRDNAFLELFCPSELRQAA